MVNSETKTPSDIKVRLSEREQQIDRALLDLRRMLFQILTETIPSDTDPGQVNSLKQRLHAMELRALENERKAVTAQKRLIELQSRQEEMENIYGEAKDRIIASEARSVELEACFEDADQRCRMALQENDNLQRQVAELHHKFEASEVRAMEAEHRAIASEARIAELQNQVIDAEQRATEAEERYLKMYQNVTEKLRALQSRRSE